MNEERPRLRWCTGATARPARVDPACPDEQVTPIGHTAPSLGSSKRLASHSRNVRSTTLLALYVFSIDILGSFSRMLVLSPRQLLVHGGPSDTAAEVPWSHERILEASRRYAMVHGQRTEHGSDYMTRPRTFHPPSWWTSCSDSVVVEKMNEDEGCLPARRVGRDGPNGQGEDRALDITSAVRFRLQSGNVLPFSPACSTPYLQGILNRRAAEPVPRVASVGGTFESLRVSTRLGQLLGRRLLDANC